MKPIVLVLLLATSALAAPALETVGLSVQTIEETRPYDTGIGWNAGLANSVLTLSDNGDFNVLSVLLEPVLLDLSNLRDSRSQALAVAQVLAILQQLAYGIPGDSCAAASAINSYVTGGPSNQYLSSLVNAIDAIILLVQNPLALRYRSAPAGGCQGGGRNYNYEAAWNGILSNANANNVGLINEEYCIAKRLANSNSVLSNNVGAALTAASLSGVIDSVQRCFPTIVSFLRAAVNGGNVNELGLNAKRALLA